MSESLQAQRTSQPTATDLVTSEDQVNKLANVILAEKQAEELMADMTTILNEYDESSSFDQLQSTKLSAIQAKISQTSKSATDIQSSFLNIKQSSINADVAGQQRVLSEAIDKHVAIQQEQGPVKKALSALLPEFLSRKIKNFTEGIKTSQEHINGILTGLSEVKNDSEKRIEELKEQEFKMGQASRVLATQILTMQIFQNKFGKFIEDLREIDASKADVAERYIGAKITRSIRDELQLVNTLQSNRINIQTILQTQELVTSELSSTMEIAKVALTTGAVVSIAAEAQKQDIEVAKTVRTTIAQLSENTAKQIKQNIVDAKDLVNGQTININQIQQQFNQAVEGLKATGELIQQETVRNQTQITGLTTQHEHMSKVLDGLVAKPSSIHDRVSQVNDKNRSKEIPGNLKTPWVGPK